MASQQPLVTPTHCLARVFRFQNKQLNYVDHELHTTSHLKWLIKECEQFTKELTKQTRNISQSMKDQTTLHEPGIASMVKEFMANKIRGKLMNSSGPKYFLSFSAFVHDTSLNDLFFRNPSAKWAIFDLQFDNLNGPSQAEITYLATK